MRQEPQGLQDRVSWFARNIDLLVEDLDYLGEGYSVPLYFDTSDVSWALLGVQAFEEDGVLTPNPRFRYYATLVQCLMSDGWLGPFGMLEPHQSEFLRGLNLDFGVERYSTIPSYLIVAFLRSLHMSAEDPVETEKLSNLSAKQLLDFVRKRAGKAVDTFKAIQIIRESWPSRLAEWRGKGVLDIGSQELDYNRLIGSETFLALRRSAESLRQGKGPANFSDAMALAILVEMAAKIGVGKVVPRFYASSSFWGALVKDARVDAQLCYTNLSGSLSSVLRDSDYYLFKALYRPADLRAVGSSADGLFTSSTELRDLQEDLRGILDAREPLTSDVLKTVQFGDRPLDEVINELKEFSFFENIWLPMLGEKDVGKMVRYLDAASRQLTRKKFFKGVEAAVESTKESLTKSAASYEKASRLWRSIRSHANFLVERLQDVVVDSKFICRDLGLLRFGVDSEIARPMVDIVEKLIDRRERDYNEALGHIMTALGRMHQRKEGLLTLSVFWILGMHREVLDLLGPQVVHRPVAIQLIYVASLVRVSPNDKRIQRSVGALVEFFNSTTDVSRRAHVACGLAYVYFRLWKATSGGRPEWRRDVDAELFEPRSVSFRYAKDAVRYAQIAAGCGELDLMKRVYARNQEAYYLIETFRGKALGRVRRSVMALLECRQDPDVWGFRYDDTIARYFHLQARLDLRSGNRIGWEQNVREALRFSELAVRGCHGHEETLSYHALLVAEDFDGEVAEGD